MREEGTKGLSTERWVDQRSFQSSDLSQAPLG